jgi:hypothetical protein
VGGGNRDCVHNDQAADTAALICQVHGHKPTCVAGRSGTNANTPSVDDQLNVAKLNAQMNQLFKVRVKFTDDTTHIRAELGATVHDKDRDAWRDGGEWH